MGTYVDSLTSNTNITTVPYYYVESITSIRGHGTLLYISIEPYIALYRDSTNLHQDTKITE